MTAAANDGTAVAAAGAEAGEPAPDSEVAALRVGIVGYGKIGQLRSDCLAAHPDFEVRAICDIDPADRKSVV